MRRFALSGLLLLAVAVGPAAAQGPWVDPALRTLLRPSARSALDRALRSTGRADEAPPRMLADIATAERDGEATVAVFLRLHAAGDAVEVEALGGRLVAAIGDLVAAVVPLRSLPALVRSDRVRRVEAARVVEPVLDSSTSAIRADEVRQRVGQRWIGFTGDNAIVGIYDTGLDFSQPDFLDGAGETRVLGLWDQTGATVDPPEGFTFGSYCSAAEVQQAVEGQPTCSQRDRNGHGTHVAGTAAGDGSAANAGTVDFRYVGVAPEAQILVVKGGEFSFFENNIVAGLQWMKQQGEAFARPVVANLSLGGQFGPHDGTRLYEIMIDSLSGPGFVVVAAAGNDGTNRNSVPQVSDQLIHAMGLPVQDMTREFTFRVPNYARQDGSCQDFAVFNVWSEAEDRLTFTVQRPDGTSLSVAHGDSATSESAEGLIYIENALQGPHPDNGDFEGYIEVSGCSANSGSPEPGIWKILVHADIAGSGTPYHMWLYATQFGGDGAAGLTGFDNRSTVTSPGTAQRAVTVGAFVSRLCLPNATTTVCTTVSQDIGDVAYFSGTGPTRDGRLKPEIAAPGRLIVSSKSIDASFPANVTTPDGRHVALQGTSMAAPHVTGAIALLLAQQPQFTPEDVKGTLAASARRDAFSVISTVDGDPGGTPNYQWGYGKLDVYALLDAIGALQPPAILTAVVNPIEPAANLLSRSGTRVPLLQLSFGAQGSAGNPEAIDLLQVGFEYRGPQAGGVLVVLQDQNGNGAVDATDPVVGTATVTPASVDTIHVDLENARVPENGSLDLLVVIELGGAVPNGATFQLAYLPGATRSAGVESRLPNPIEQSTSAVLSQTARTTVLLEGEVFTLSENPVRSGRVIFSFAERPRRADIYTLDGRLVSDLLTRANAAGLRAQWDVTNDAREPVAAGIYLLVVDVAGQIITEKLFVAPAAGQEE
ncbi:MAG: S8 family serine peptidase [Longimicrobiales bacterium]